MYSYKKQVNINFNEAVAKTKQELSKQGFGVLTEIDVQATLKKKLNVSLEKYIILGACNPSLALKALQTETEIGLMLPCNVIIYENQGKTFVSTILPTVAMNMINNDELKEIAANAEKKLRKAVESI